MLNSRRIPQGARGEKQCKNVLIDGGDISY